MKYEKIIAFLLLLIPVFLSGCIFGDEPYSIATEQYQIGWLLHNINPSTPTDLNFSLSELAVYNYTFNYPANESVRYSNIVWWIEPCHNATGCIDFEIWNEIAVPLKRTYYLLGNNSASQYYGTNWSFSNYMTIIYLPEYKVYEGCEEEHYFSENVFYAITPVPGERKNIYFGTAPYQPTNLNVSEKTLSLLDHLLRSYNRTAYLLKETWIFPEELRPRYEIYLNGTLNSSGFFENWNYSSLNYLFPANGSYKVVITIPSNYPLWKVVKIEANFSLPSTDSQPPVLDWIDTKPYFEHNKAYEVKFKVGDNVGISNATIFYTEEPEDGKAEWITLPLTQVPVTPNTIYIYNTTINVTNISVDKIGVKISINDTSNNQINYTILPIASVGEKTLISLSSDNRTVRGGRLYIEGNITDAAGNGISNLKLDFFLNNTYLGADRSEYENPRVGTLKGEYQAEFEVPCSLNYGKVNLSVNFNGTGVYLPAENKIEIEIVESNFSVNETVPVHSSSLINASALGALLTINRTDLNWTWSTVIREREFNFTPRNYGNYTIKFNTTCGECVTRTIFANITELPQFFPIYRKPYYPMSKESITFIITTYSQGDHVIYGNISNATWQQPLNISWRGVTYYDQLTNEPYNGTLCQECWNATINLTTGRYNLTLKLKDEIGQEAYLSQDIFVYPPMNITFILTDHLGRNVERGIKMYFDGRFYGDYLIVGTREITLPNVSYFVPEHDVSSNIGLAYPSQALVTFRNVTMDKTMKIISEDYKGRLFTNNKILCSFHAFEPSWTYKEILFNGSYNLTELGISAHMKLIESEGFEAGVVPRGWLTGGDKGWNVSSKEVFLGTYALRAGNITHNQLSWLSKTITIDQPKVISFWYKVSSEKRFDYFRFFVNNTLYFEDSGLTPWKKFSLKLDPGTWVLNWTYSKDKSISRYDDTVYLDEFSILTWPIKLWSCDEWDFAAKNCKVGLVPASIITEALREDILHVQAKGSTEAFVLGVDQYCGDGYCNPNIGESYTSCPADCPAPPTPAPPTPAPPAVTEETKTITLISPPAPATLTLEKSDILKIQEIRIEVKRPVSNVKITVKESSKPAAAPEPVEPSIGKTYKYVEIIKANLRDEDISRVKIKFKVEKSWISANSIDENKVFLQRWYNNIWNKLATSKVGEDPTYVYYEAESPGLSMFAITGERITKVCPPLEKRCYNNELQRCSPDGMSWQTIEVCAYGCNITTLMCNPAPTCVCPPPSDWSDCIEGIQKRTNYKCDETTAFKCVPYEEVRECKEITEISIEGLIIGISVVSIGVFIFIFLMKQRKKIALRKTPEEFSIRTVISNGEILRGRKIRVNAFLYPREKGEYLISDDSGTLPAYGSAGIPHGKYIIEGVLEKTEKGYSIFIEKTTPV